MVCVISANQAGSTKNEEIYDGCKAAMNLNVAGSASGRRARELAFVWKLKQRKGYSLVCANS